MSAWSTWQTLLVLPLLLDAFPSRYPGLWQRLGSPETHARHVVKAPSFSMTPKSHRTSNHASYMYHPTMHQPHIYPKSRRNTQSLIPAYTMKCNNRELPCPDMRFKEKNGSPSQGSGRSSHESRFRIATSKTQSAHHSLRDSAPPRAGVFCKTVEGFSGLGGCVGDKATPR